MVDLVERLLEFGNKADHRASSTMLIAADRIAELEAKLAEANKALEAFINRIPAAAWKLPDGALVAKTGIEIEYFRAARRALTAQETRHD